MIWICVRRYLHSKGEGLLIRAQKPKGFRKTMVLKLLKPSVNTEVSLIPNQTGFLFFLFTQHWHTQLVSFIYRPIENNSHRGCNSSQGTFLHTDRWSRLCLCKGRTAAAWKTLLLWEGRCTRVCLFVKFSNVCHDPKDLVVANMHNKISRGQISFLQHCWLKF